MESKSQLESFWQPNKGDNFSATSPSPNNVVIFVLTLVPFIIEKGPLGKNINLDEK